MDPKLARFVDVFVKEAVGAKPPVPVGAVRSIAPRRVPPPTRVAPRTPPSQQRLPSFDAPETPVAPTGRPTGVLPASPKPKGPAVPADPIDAVSLKLKVDKSGRILNQEVLEELPTSADRQQAMVRAKQRVLGGPAKLTEMAGSAKRAVRQRYEAAKANLQHLIESPMQTKTGRRAITMTLVGGLLYYMFSGKAPQASGEGGQAVAAAIVSGGAPASPLVPTIAMQSDALNQTLSAAKTAASAEDQARFDRAIQVVTQVRDILSSSAPDVVIDDPASLQAFIGKVREGEAAATAMIGHLEAIDELLTKYNQDGLIASKALRSTLANYLLEISDSRQI